jgi:predicted O-linked N-acetylglucosamine transferase (SPINDLY family)
VIELWSKVLKAVPKSRLLLKYTNWYEQELLRENMLSGFSDFGVERDQIKYAVQNDTMFEHLGAYKEVDIALDPFPFNGTTTTYQALWMGVPVITLAGVTFSSRTAGSILYHLGVDDLIVDSPEGYIACAQELAADGMRLGKLRSSLREQIIRSPLCDASAYALTVETAYREMWQTWCEKFLK